MVVSYHHYVFIMNVYIVSQQQVLLLCGADILSGYSEGYFFQDTANVFVPT